jgi:lysophospholipase L1-like esterase
LLLAAVVMTGWFVVFEAGLRMKGGSEADPEFRQLFMDDDRMGYRLRPGARARFRTPEFETDIVINSAGVRDEEIGPKARDERRIVVLGDSLVMSVQVPLEQTFTKRLEARLNANPREGGLRYRVINAGVQGYGPVETRLFFEHVARHFEADAVLVAVFVGNDAVEAVASAARLDPDRRATSAAREEVATALRRTVRNSMVLQILRLRVNTLTERFGRGQDLSGPLTTYVRTPPPEIDRGLELTRQCVASIAETARAGGARTALLLMPARFQTDDDDFTRLETILAQGGQTLMRDAATDRFRTALAPLGLPTMDALEALRAAPRRQELFFQQTVHLTPRGHEVLAEALERFLRASGLGAPPGAVPAGLAEP